MPDIAWFEKDYFERRLIGSSLTEAFIKSAELCIEENALSNLRETNLWKATLKLCADVDMSREVEGVAYHNKNHFCDAVLAAGLLAKNEPCMEAQVKLVLLAIMCAHDINHDGTTNSPTKNLEMLSAEAFQKYLRNGHVPDEHQELIYRVILSTDPKLASANRRDYAASTTSNTIEEYGLLVGLAHDADLLASLLPAAGENNTKLLAKEWEYHKQPNAFAIITYSGRASFLMNVHPISRAAEIIGLNKIHQEQLVALASFDGSTAGKSPVKGGLSLDSLPPSQAAEKYKEALICAALKNHSPCIEDTLQYP